MFGLVGIVNLVLGLVAVGLLVYVIATWITHPVAEKVKKWLGPLYLPFLQPLRSRLRPARVGKLEVDVAPWVLLAAILVFRFLVVGILS